MLDKSSSRSVYLGVCFVQFALYVKLRTAIDQELRIGVRITTRQYIANYNEQSLNMLVHVFGTLRLTMVERQ